MPPPVTRTYSLAAADADGISASQSPGAGAILINGALASGGVATLDNARRVEITSAGNDSGITFTVIGTDRNGYSQSETITGGNVAAVATTRDFKTVTSVTHTGTVAAAITIGTNSTGSTAPVICNAFATYANIGLLAQLVSGSATFSVEITNQDYSPDWNLLATTPNWSAPDGMIGTTASTWAGLTATSAGYIRNPVTMLRLTITSGTGQVKLNVQYSPSEGWS